MEQNRYQRSILDSEKFYHGSAIGNIGGVLMTDRSVTYNQMSDVFNSMLIEIPSIRIRVNKDGKLYEGPYSFYNLKHVKLDASKEEAIEYADSIMSKPFGDVYDEALYYFEYIEYDSGVLVMLKLHHLIADSVTIAVLCRFIDEGISARAQEKEIQTSIPAVKYSEPDEALIFKASDWFKFRLDGFVPGRLSSIETSSCSAERLFFKAPLLHRHMAPDFILAVYTYLRGVMDKSAISIGFVLANRKKEEMNMPGMFANTLPLIIDTGDKTVRDAIKQIARDVFSLVRFSAYSLNELIEDNIIKERLFDVSISYRYQEHIPQMTHGTLHESFSGAVDVPIRIGVDETDDDLSFSITYKKDLFSRERIMSIGSSIKSILGRLENDSQVSSLSILNQSDEAIYKKLNDTYKEHKYKDIETCWKAHLSDNTSLVWESGNISSKELYERACRVAAWLTSRSAQRVAVNMPRSCEMMEAIMGCVLAGAAFMVVSDKKDADGICDTIVNSDDIHEAHNVSFEEYVPQEFDRDTSCYLIRTSGSTGSPKCIEISRSSLISRLEWANSKYGLDGTILQKTVNTFDVSVWEVMSVIYGSKLCLLNPGDEKLPDKIASAMINYKVSKVHFVPSILQYFLLYVKNRGLSFPYLCEVYVSGEKLESSTVVLFKEVLPGKRLINYYGPAECTIDVTSYECNLEVIPEDIPIGTPADNTGIMIINSEGTLLPLNAMGEICISGELVGKGYTSGETGGYCTVNGVKSYKTGDIGSVDDNGNLHIYGRSDSQVKLRGIKLDLLNIKNIILECDGVVNAHVVMLDNRLVCCYCGQLDIDKAKHLISDRISNHAIPSRFVRMDSLPLTESGKIDEKSIIKLLIDKEAGVNVSSKDRTFELDKTGNAILSEVRSCLDVGPDDNLFHAGLDSLSILDIVCTLQKKGINIEFSDFYEYSTVREIAGHLESKVYFTYLKKINSDKLLICFPYAGGEPVNFKDLADLMNCDVIGIYSSVFSSTPELESAAIKLKEALPVESYKKVYVYGHCIGSMSAIVFAGTQGIKADGLILAMPSIRTSMKPGKSPWRLLSDKAISRLLEKSGFKGMLTEQAVHKFRTDTDRYFAFVPTKPFRINAQEGVTVIFGSRDPFTTGRGAIVRKIKSIAESEVDVHVISDSGHYLENENILIIHQIINGKYNI